MAPKVHSPIRRGGVTAVPRNPCGACTLPWPATTVLNARDGRYMTARHDDGQA